MSKRIPDFLALTLNRSASCSSSQHMANQTTAGKSLAHLYRGVLRLGTSRAPLQGFQARIGMRRILALLLTFLLGCVAAPRIVAQETAVGLSPGLNAALVRLFGEHKAFAAQLRIRMTDGQGAETLNAPMRFALLDGKMRGDLDVTKMQSKDLPALAASAAKSVGMEKVVTLVRPDKAETYLLYPAFQSCIVAPIDAGDLAALKQPAKIQRTPLARETLDGHPCVKTKVVVTEPDGRQHESTVWYATDLKDFPLRLHTVDGTDTLDLHFSQIRFVRPETKDFDLPAGTTRYDDVQTMTQAVMKKLLKEAIGGK